MNAPETTVLELEPVTAQPRPAALPATLAENSPASLMLRAMSQGVSPEQVEKMLALQERWEANEARKAYNTAFAAFKAEAVKIIRNRSVTDGPLKGKAYAELFAVNDAVTPALSKHGLGASWKVTKDEKDWLEVTCMLRHSGGHFETVTLGGPPDTSGAKNALQARNSTVTYLERATLKAICGVAEAGQDDDGAGGAEGLREQWLTKVRKAKTMDETVRLSQDGSSAFTKAKDVEGYREFAAALQTRRQEIRKEAGDA